MIHRTKTICPRCDAREFKLWSELSRDELILAERLPISTEYKPTERKKHRICTRCWFEDAEFEMKLA